MRSFLNFLFGKPLASSEDKQEKIGPSSGIAVFGLDALSSAAYGPEAALTILIPLGAAGLVYITPITILILILLGIVYFSYRQTIAAYPQGGGSYTVAHENLGVHTGLLAAAALMIDYVLNVAVGISAGVGALVSAVPSLQQHTLAMCLGILVLLTIVNLRGLREAGAVFMYPTYLFIGSVCGTIVWGLVKVAISGGHPHSAVPPVPVSKATEAVERMAADEGVRERVHGDDRRGSSQQRGTGVSREGGGQCAPHADDHYRDSDGDAAGDCVSGAYVRDCGAGAGVGELSERSLATDCRGDRARGVLLCLNGGDSVCAGAFGEYVFCRFSSRVPGGCGQSLPAVGVHAAGTPVGLRAGDLRAGGAGGHTARRLRRRYR